MGLRITDTLVKALAAPSKLPAKGNKITYDTEAQGFGVRTTAAGAQRFILNYRTRAGRERRFTIGPFPDWTVKAAREEARRLRALIDLGGDPLAEIEAGRDAPTVADLCRRYEDEHLPRKRPRSAEEDRTLIRTRILPALGSIKVADVTYNDIDGLHRNITKQGKPYRANRTVSLLSKMFSLASTKWKLRPDNPCRGIERNSEQPRERYLSADELSRLSEVLAEHTNREAADAIRLLLLTGARRNEVLSATWAQFDLTNGLWTKPSSHTKQKRLHHVPLSPPALELLVKLRERSTSEYVFPGKDGHRISLDAWKAIRKAARLNGVRLHDLRHTFASILASGGASLPMIGKLLGHSNVGTTARYAHLAVDPLRELTTRVGAIVTGRPEADVIPISKVHKPG
jgi:integrase